MAEMDNRVESSAGLTSVRAGLGQEPYIWGLKGTMVMFLRYACITSYVAVFLTITFGYFLYYKN
ncbi:hypothetical protein B0I35DRAFT_484408 [Stachybotrys elegans]|uniref:Uncharacterized protein n=1 Tax=Stachybotrys elegans TaxID=80388 RepID=A0A8K0SF07_9HYPO|nr:hypothetical protein B0I35DRAFT_484408 [Stachybotrys elegans]